MRWRDAGCGRLKDVSNHIRDASSLVAINDGLQVAALQDWIVETQFVMGKPGEKQ